MTKEDKKVSFDGDTKKSDSGSGDPSHTQKRIPCGAKKSRREKYVGQSTRSSKFEGTEEDLTGYIFDCTTQK